MGTVPTNAFWDQHRAWAEMGQLVMDIRLLIMREHPDIPQGHILNVVEELCRKARGVSDVRE
jgi:hypothetical protein